MNQQLPSFQQPQPCSGFPRPSTGGGPPPSELADSRGHQPPHGFLPHGIKGFPNVQLHHPRWDCQSSAMRMTLPSILYAPTGTCRLPGAGAPRGGAVTAQTTSVEDSVIGLVSPHSSGGPFWEAGLLCCSPAAVRYCGARAPRVAAEQHLQGKPSRLESQTHSGPPHSQKRLGARAKAHTAFHRHFLQCLRARLTAFRCAAGGVGHCGRGAARPCAWPAAGGFP